MFFINELQKIRNDNSGKIAVFIDMDGVVADYRYGEGKNIENKVFGIHSYKKWHKIDKDIITKTPIILIFFIIIINIISNFLDFMQFLCYYLVVDLY